MNLPAETEKPRPPHTLTVLIPCFNEAATLAEAVDRVRAIENEDLELDVVLIDDGSEDESRALAVAIGERFGNVRTLLHDRNRGKGAALHTGIAAARGDFVAIQDADLEYDPRDLLRLVGPLIDGDADVVIGSRFLSHGVHRVLYFWHTLGNRFLTLLSNMCTDLCLTDMESCHKVFRRELLQSLKLREERFGFEPEVVAAVAHRRARVVEMGVSYLGRTFAQGKKIRARDGFRALYCILRYNAFALPAPVQFLLYAAVGGVCAAVNLVVFLGLLHAAGASASLAAPVAFAVAAALNYALCVGLLFRSGVRWKSRAAELAVYAGVVVAVGAVDRWVTLALLGVAPAAAAKLAATGVGLLLNFAGRRLLVFPERGRPGRPHPQTPLNPTPEPADPEEARLPSPPAPP